MALSALKVVAQLKGTISKTLTDGSTPSFTYTKGLFEEVPTDANLLYTQGHAIASSGSLDLDLAGSLVDALGVACVFSKVYALLVINTATATGRIIEVAGDAASVPLANAADNAIKVGPKGCFFLSSMLDGFAVTGTTADIIQISNVAGGASITVHVAILGKA